MGGFPSKKGKNKLLNYNNDSFYIGNINYQGELEGNGKYIDENGNVYIGNFENNNYHGFGVMEYYYNEFGFLRYEGFWNNNCKQGKGKMIFIDGSIYEGDFYLDDIHGKGKLKYSEGYSYEGEFCHNKKCHNGKYLDCNNKIIYEGEWLNDLYHGNGILYYSNGKIKYKGEFKKGHFNGIGIHYLSNGEKNLKAFFYNGVISEIYEKYHKYELNDKIFEIDIDILGDQCLKKNIMPPPTAPPLKLSMSSISYV